MNETMSFLIILEFVAPFALVSVVLLMILLKGNKKSKDSLNKLLQGVQDSEENYSEKLIEFFKKIGLEDKVLDDAVHLFSKNRRAFFKRLLSSLTLKDAELMLSVGPKFTDLVEQYHQLEFQATAVEVEEEEISEEKGTDFSEVKVFKRENKRLKAEVHVSVSALNSLFKEYASMFGEVPDEKQEMSVQEILESMEKFTKGEFKPDNITDDLPPEMLDEKSQIDEPKSATEDHDEEKSTNDGEQKDAVTNEEVEIVENETATVDNETSENIADESNLEDDSTVHESTETVDVVENDEKDDDSEPNWDEAFEEAGETMPDESAANESTDPEASADTRTEKDKE